jgi:hypothetical protein
MCQGQWIDRAQVQFSKQTSNKTGQAKVSTKLRKAQLSQNIRTDRACNDPVHNSLSIERSDFCVPAAVGACRDGTSLAYAMTEIKFAGRLSFQHSRAASSFAA